MGVQLSKKKQIPFWVSVLYKLKALLPLSKKAQLKLFLNLEWIFERFAIEASFDHYPLAKHPFRTHNPAFILDFIQPSHKVLDLGCGLGFISYSIAEKAKKVIGIDASKKDIEKAQLRFQRDNLEYRCVDALTFLQLQSDSFDVLILSHILEHIEQPEAFLHTYKGFFKHIFIELPDFDKTYLNPIRQDLNLHLIFSDLDHVVEYDREEMKTVLEKCGLTIVQSDFRMGVQRYWCAV